MNIKGKFVTLRAMEREIVNLYVECLMIRTWKILWSDGHSLFQNSHRKNG